MVEKGRNLWYNVKKMFAQERGVLCMIKSITMKNCATYTEDGAKIENCQKVNFFYGPNGSGKSTISNFLQNPMAVQYSKCAIEWENDAKLDVVVYNREFRERNFQENIDGVFTLGQATIEEIETLEKMKEQRSQLSDTLTTRETSLKKKIDEESAYRISFRDSVWDRILKPNETVFQDAFAGFRSSKEKFRDEVLRRYQISHSSSDSRESLIAKAQTLFSKKPERCDPIPLLSDEIITLISEIERVDVWKKIVVGNSDLPIGRLIEDLGNADWVSQGRKHIGEGEIGPFCQQSTLSDEFKKQLDAFFSGEYEKDVKAIKTFKESYVSKTDELIAYLSGLITSLKLYAASRIDEEKLISAVELLRGYFSQNKAEIQMKEQEPSRVVSLLETSSLMEAIKQLIADGNTSIALHNAMVDNFTIEKNSLISDIWSFLLSENESWISGYLSSIEDYKKAKTGIQRGINVFKEQLEELTSKIIEAGRNVTSVQPTVDEINRSLLSYGFTNFKIVPSPVKANAYQIQRMDGTLVSNTLSEGEETFELNQIVRTAQKGDLR